MKNKAARPIPGARIFTEQEFCATCNDFPRDAIKNGARGKCAIKGVAFHHASPACPIFQAAGDRSERRALVAQLSE